MRKVHRHTVSPPSHTPLLSLTKHTLTTPTNHRDKNTQARLMNSQLWRSPGSRLQPLHNTATFEPIADFPATIDAANRLSGAAVTRLLAQLGIVVDASQTVAEKRRAFKRAIGVLSEISSNY